MFAPAKPAPSLALHPGLANQPATAPGRRPLHAPSPGAHPLARRIVGLPNPGGVDERYRIAIEIELHLDDSRVVPACGDTFATSRRASWFISVDLPTFGDRYRDHQAVAQPFTLSLCRKDFFNFLQQRFDFCDRRRNQSAGTSPSSENRCPPSISAEASMIRARQSRALSPSKPLS